MKEGGGEIERNFVNIFHIQKIAFEEEGNLRSQNVMLRNKEIIP